MTQTIEPAASKPALSALDLGDTRNLRIVRDAEKNSIWAFGRMRQLYFMTGHARSGTTWAAAILMRHPRIFCDGEFHFQQLRTGFDAFQRQPWHRATRDPVHTTAECCFQDTLRLCLGACSHQKLEADWVGDRTPRPLEVLLPGAPHFVIVRDGRDVLVSTAIMEINNGGGIFSQFSSEPTLSHARDQFLADENFFKNNPFELLVCEPFVRTIARKWATQAHHDLRVGSQIKAGEIDASVHFVFYEKLHQDPEGERNKMYAFLNVDPAEALPLTVESRTLPGLKTDNHRSDKRKGVVGDWVNYFTDDAKRWFKDEAGQALIDMGYEKDLNW